jgi:hypothetical protein
VTTLRGIPQMFDDSAQAADRAVVVISYYDRRPTACLQDLLKSLGRHKAGRDFEVVVVVNQTREDLPALPGTPYPLTVIGRENTGMNIGAWEAGWRHLPGRPVYVFMQDECLVIRDGWLAAYADRCAEPGVGLVGESLNLAWDRPWSHLRVVHAGARMPDHLIDGNPADRVDVYLDCLQRWGIDPGESASHLRSLVWAATHATLSRIDGFPIGGNYGDCIAAEIAVSRKVEAARLRIVQVRQAPFYFTMHREWNQDRPGGHYVNGKSPANLVTWDLPDRKRLDQEAERLMALFGRDEAETDYVLMVSALVGKLMDREAQIAKLCEALAQTNVRGKVKSA